jgi:hypothetical protein
MHVPLISNRTRLAAANAREQFASSFRRGQHNNITLSPSLRAALRELASDEGLPLSALVAVLVNEALGRRLAERGR